MAADSVDSAQYVNDSIDNEHLAANSVQGSGSGASGDNVIQAASIGLADMGVNSVDSDQYVDSSIDNVHVAANTLKADKFNMDNTGTPTGQFSHSVRAILRQIHWIFTLSGCFETVHFFSRR